MNKCMFLYAKFFVFRCCVQNDKAILSNFLTNLETLRLPRPIAIVAVVAVVVIVVVDVAVVVVVVVFSFSNITVFVPIRRLGILITL